MILASAPICWLFHVGRLSSYANKGGVKTDMVQLAPLDSHTGIL